MKRQTWVMIGIAAAAAAVMLYSKRAGAASPGYATSPGFAYPPVMNEGNPSPDYFTSPGVAVPKYTVGPTGYCMDVNGNYVKGATCGDGDRIIKLDYFDENGTRWVGGVPQRVAV